MNEERNREIWLRRKRGESCRSIAASYGITGTRVSQIYAAMERKRWAKRNAAGSSAERGHVHSGTDGADNPADILPKGPVRVAVYIRTTGVSEQSASTMQHLHSEYRTEIERIQGWSVAGFYEDAGVDSSARDAMIMDCLNGKADMIYTRSILRFATSEEEVWRIAERLKNNDPPVGIWFSSNSVFTMNEASVAAWKLFLKMLEEEPELL